MDFFSPTREPHRDHAHDTQVPVDKGDSESDMEITLELPGLKHARSPARRMQEQSNAEPRPTQRRRLTLEKLDDNDIADSSFRTANEEVMKNVDVLHEILDDNSDMEITQTHASPFANRVFSGVPEGDRDLLSPIAARGIRSPQALYSPRRTFFLHGNNAPRSHYPSPMRPTTSPAASPLRHPPPPTTPTRDSPSTTNRTRMSALPGTPPRLKAATPPRFTAATPSRLTTATPPRLREATPKRSLSPRRYSASSRSSIYTRRTGDQSVNLDEMMDRVISMNEDQNSKHIIWAMSGTYSNMT